MERLTEAFRRESRSATYYGTVRRGIVSAPGAGVHQKIIMRARPRPRELQYLYYSP